MRRAARKDGNHRAIVEAFEEAGCATLDLSGVGNGCPDLMVATSCVVVLVEIKDGDNKKFTAAQKRFAETWPSPVIVIRSVETAVELASKLMESTDPMEEMGEEGDVTLH